MQKTPPDPGDEIDLLSLSDEEIKDIVEREVARIAGPRLGLLEKHVERRIPRPLRRAKNPHTVEDVLAALQAGDPGPFFNALRWNPALLTNPALFTLTIGKWWLRKSEASTEGKQARQYLKKIGAVLADPLGRPEQGELPAEESAREANRKRQTDYRRQDFEAEEKLRAAIAAAQSTLPAAMPWQKRQAEEAKIENAVLDKVLTSHNPHQRKAAEKLKKQRDRERH